jgi:glycosyltransferase involved in cell wall biosynthesis
MYAAANYRYVIVKKYKILHLVRDVGPTSMPWNDLYKVHTRLNRCSPGVVCMVSMTLRPGMRVEKSSKLRYFVLQFMSAAYMLHRFVKNRRSRGSMAIIHIHNMSLIPYGIYCKFIGAKVLLNIHNSLENFTVAQKFMLRWGVLVFDGFVPVSVSVGRELCLAYPSIEPKMTPICNGVQVEPVEKVNNLLVVEKKEIDLILVARFVEQKNVFRILNVIMKSNKIKNVVWYGDGLYFKEAQKITENSSLKEKVQFRGIRPREEVLNAINRSTIYLSLSLWEGLGVANMEALSLPTEVVLSDIPPHRELHNRDNLTLVDLSLSDEAIVDVLDALIEKSESRDQWLLNRAREARAEHNVERMVREYVNVYQSLTE